MLAFKLSRQKLSGKEGLQYVLCEIVKAQKLGKIRPPETRKLNKFALCLRKNIGMKLSKQDRDTELIKVISSKHSEILKRLLKDNIFEQEDQLEVRIEKVFDRVARTSKQHLETYFNTIDMHMNAINEELDEVKKQMASLEENQGSNRASARNQR